ncbi:hypothetical protein V5F77_20540 [Xanthobacter sp. DSM 24535]|uniref:hypothetical protein n=1 Tax=Roseixanthobacter psychrophilus TaxID=3119917 RepID=UPI00372C06C8
MQFIVLTAAQSDAVYGTGADGARLEPVCLAGGAPWVLPVTVLADPAHAGTHQMLSALPIREVAPDEWPPSDLA